MDNLKNKAVTFCKAQFSAWISSAVDFGLTLLLANLCGVWYGYATFLGAVSGGITNCAINYKWVFHAFGMKKKYIAMRYTLVWCGSILLNTCGTYLLTEFSGQNFIIAKIIVAVLVAVLWNYQMQCNFVFPAKNNNQNTY